MLSSVSHAGGRGKKDAERVAHPFAPFFDEKSKILILGSFPSVASRANGFYYGNRRNRFWKVLAVIHGEEEPDSIKEKKAFLARHGIALWDVIASCGIRGSSDASVFDARPNDIPSILEKAPIERIALNGKKAEELFDRYYSRTIVKKVFSLPSTSPANAAWNLFRLIEVWSPVFTEDN